MTTSPGRPSGVDNGRDDLLRASPGERQQQFGHRQPLLRGRRRGRASVRPARPPVIIRLVAGSGNYVATNHVVAMDVHATSSDSAFAAQVDALLTTGASDGLGGHGGPGRSRVGAGTPILDSGTDAQVVVDRLSNAFRATPDIGSAGQDGAFWSYFLHEVRADPKPGTPWSVVTTSDLLTFTERGTAISFGCGRSATSVRCRPRTTESPQGRAAHHRHSRGRRHPRSCSGRGRVTQHPHLQPDPPPARPLRQGRGGHRP